MFPILALTILYSRAGGDGNDDGPSITATTMNEPTLTVDETVLATNATAGFAAQFTSSFGADGAAAATPVSYALSTPGGASGLTDTASNNPVFLFLESGQVVGREGTDATAAAAGDIVFTVSVNANGQVTLDQQRAVVHTNPNDPDESRGLIGSGLMTLTATATDGDGDHAAASLDLTPQLVFKDDGPSITASAVNAPTLTVDETTLATDATAGFAAQFTSNFGAAGAAAATPVSYALSTPGGASGLTDTASNNPVFLFLESGQVVGREGTDATAAAAGDIVFTVSVNANGQVTLDQQRAVVHTNPNDPDESRGLTGSGLITLTATATDGDGDHAAASLDLTPLLVFKDDGPSITASAVNAPTLTVDETTLATDATAGFAAQFTPIFGADGAAAATPVSYALFTPGGASGLADTASNNPVFLFLESGQVVGREGTDATAAAAGDIVFTVSVNANGQVTLDQQRAVVHTNPNDPDESRGLTGSGLITLTATATNSASLDLTPLLVFKDDGPSITASAVNAPTLTVDETTLATDATAGFAAQFTPIFGADGAAAATPVSYALFTPGGASGLADTASNNPVFLFLESGQVVGREGTDATDAAAGDIVFTVSVNANGQVTLDQQRAVVHTNPNDPDESRGLTGSGLITLTATATDGDGDHAAASLDLTPLLVFKDDGPAIDPVDSIVNFANGETTGPKALNEVAGADGFSSHQITSFPSPLILADGTMSLSTKLDNNNTVLTYFNDTSNPGVIDPGEAFFKLTLNNNNTYTFDVLHDLPPITVPLNFAAIASGGPRRPSRFRPATRA